MFFGGRADVAIGRPALALAVLGVVGLPGRVAAQDGLIVQPAVPQGFDRGRNISVRSRARPSFAPVGIRVGGLTAFPQLRSAAGATSNAYLTRSDPRAAPFVALEPSVRITSGWSRHAMEITAGAAERRYIGAARRNERTWTLGGQARADLGRAITVKVEARALQGMENQFSGEVAATIAALSRYRSDTAAARVEYVRGRLRAFAMVDRAAFRFAPLPLIGAEPRDQSGRDRTIDRLVGQVEYARSPSVSLFAQLAHADTRFGRAGSAGLGSRGLRALGGVNADVAGWTRGSLAVGYGWRDYDLGGTHTIAGPIVEARGELFVGERFTVSLTGRRTIEDLTAGNDMPRPFWDNRLSIGADYEARENVILSAGADCALQTRIGADARTTTCRLASGARFLASRRATMTIGASFARRRSRGAQAGSDAGEGRLEAGLTFHL